MIEALNLLALWLGYTVLVILVWLIMALLFGLVVGKTIKLMGSCQER